MLKSVVANRLTPRRLPMSDIVRFAAFAAIVALAACSTTSSRIQGKQAEFDRYPAEAQQKIRAGEVGVGFTQEQVRLALGEPSRTYTQQTAAWESEVWAYQDSKPAFSFGLGGYSGGGTSVGGGVGVGTGGNSDDKVRVTFVGGLVTAVEQVTKP